jgi:hypothetical protein
MLADFAVVPIGVTGGVKELVAEALKSYLQQPCMAQVHSSHWESCSW